MKLLFLLVLLLLPAAGSIGAAEPAAKPPAAAGVEESLRPVDDVPGLPRVLLIGDSISMGYTAPVRKLLQGKANVHRPADNCSGTRYGLQKLDQWLGSGKWDVIHFNFGLHDAKLPPEGVRYSSPADYERNLRELVQRLRATGARLIWATTTPVPNGGYLAPNRRFGSIAQYNAVARKVMDDCGVAIDDLGQAIAPHVATMQKPGDVHFTPEGSELLARQVAAAIEAELARPASAGRPNILWIVADDHAAWITGAYGNRQVRTPNLDRLAASGVRFDRAFCNSPVCTASRGSFLTGRYPRTIGVTQLPTPLPDSETTLAELLDPAGYDTALVGKTHFNSALKHGFDLLCDLREYRQWLAGRKVEPMPESIECYPGRGATQGKGGLFDPATAAQSWNARCLPAAVRDADSDGTFLAGRAAEFLQQKRDRPFFLMVSFHQPHMPFQFPIEYAGKYRPEDFSVPKPGPEDDWQIPAVFRNLTDAERRGIAAACYTSTEYMDKNVGLVLDALDRSGQGGNTLVIYIGDNGYLLGQHGRFEKHCSYQEAVRQPLLVRLPGRTQPGRVTEALVEYIDILPTVLEACGQAVPTSVQGRSLLPLLDGRTDRHRDYVFVEYAINDEAMVFDGRWKLVYERGMRRRTEGYDPGLPLPGPTVRLFDLKNDPNEWTNLSRREDCRAQTDRLLALLADILKRTDRQPQLLPKTEDPLETIAHCVQPRDVEPPTSFNAKPKAPVLQQ